MAGVHQVQKNLKMSAKSSLKKNVCPRSIGDIWLAVYTGNEDNFMNIPIQNLDSLPVHTANQISLILLGHTFFFKLLFALIFCTWCTPATWHHSRFFAAWLSPLYLNEGRRLGARSFSSFFPFGGLCTPRAFHLAARRGGILKQIPAPRAVRGRRRHNHEE